MIDDAVKLAQEGMDKAIDLALEKAGDGTEVIYVSIDVDAIDQSHGSFDAYLHDALGVSDFQRLLLQAQLLESG